uniref:Uncharacterized protein n=1 Tax=Emiliania huxleyi TaxID=2903 RepID=A0A7S3RT65_EMIHU
MAWVSVAPVETRRGRKLGRQAAAAMAVAVMVAMVAAVSHSRRRSTRRLSIAARVGARTEEVTAWVLAAPVETRRGRKLGRQAAAMEVVRTEGAPALEPEAQA